MSVCVCVRVREREREREREIEMKFLVPSSLPSSRPMHLSLELNIHAVMCR